MPALCSALPQLPPDFVSSGLSRCARPEATGQVHATPRFRLKRIFSWSSISAGDQGFNKNFTPEGSALAVGCSSPDVSRTAISGDSLVRRIANSKPSIDPGIWISVSTAWMSGCSSRHRNASSALLASLTAYPSSASSAANSQRASGSSSTTSTGGVPARAHVWSSVICLTWVAAEKG